MDPSWINHVFRSAAMLRTAVTLIHTVGMKANTCRLPAALCPQQCSTVRLRWPALRKSCATLLYAVLAEPKESENCKDDHDSTDPPYYTVHNVLLVESNIVATRFFPVSSSACCRIDEASNWPPPTLANVKEPHAIVYPTFRLKAESLLSLPVSQKRSRANPRQGLAGPSKPFRDRRPMGDAADLP